MNVSARVVEEALVDLLLRLTHPEAGADGPHTKNIPQIVEAEGSGRIGRFSRIT